MRDYNSIKKIFLKIRKEFIEEKYLQNIFNPKKFILEKKDEKRR